MDSAASKSVEHIIPESLWNKTHVLPKGVVCDACNNYFAREVEKPFLDSPAISTLRFTQAIPNKRGRIPASRAVLLPEFPVVAHRETSGPYALSLVLPPDAYDHIVKHSTGTLLLSASDEPPSERIVSRFLAKMALEAMASRLLQQPGGISYLVDELQLDPIRTFARRGHPRTWPHSVRRIYDVERAVVEMDGHCYQTVHEFDFLVTTQQEWYFVFALFGLELAINVGGPEMEGYFSWLAENDGRSPLYSGKNAT